MNRLLTAFATLFFILGVSGLVTPGTFGGLGTPVAAAQGTKTAATTVGVWSESGELDIDREFLENETEKLPLPDEVKHVEYLVFSENDEKFNDTVEKWVKANRPELLADSKQRWANGVLISAVGLDPRKNGIYCGDDVCSAMGLNNGRHRDYALEGGKSSFKAKRFGAGLLEQVKAANEDPSVHAAKDKRDETFGWLFGGIGTLTGIGAAIGAIFYGRNQRAKRTRNKFDYISKNYGRVAGALQEIDVRAHNLTSPLANDELRKQWTEVRDTFLELHDTQSRIPDLFGADKKTLLKYSKDVGKMHLATERMEKAEENINKLFDMEHGSVDARRRELSDLRSNLREAKLETSKYDADVDELIARVEQLSQQLDSPDFMNTYAVLLADSAQVFKYVTEEKDYKGTDGEVPKLYDKDWRPGYGYNSYVPFVTYSAWHSDAVAAASSSSTDTTYSSGFTGGGGSSSW